MNEKLQYASMLEIPVNTCKVTKLTHKKRRPFKKKRVNDEQVKAQLLKKVNEEQELKQEIKVESQQEDVLEQQELTLENENPVQQNACSVSVSKEPKKRKPFKFSIVGVQLVIIGALVLTILLTNTLYADSGINVFLREVFGTESTITDVREYDEFSPVISMGNNSGVSVKDGIITFSGEGSVYAPCDGKVSKVIQTESGKFDVEIMHSQNFISVISDVEHVYVTQGDVVYSNIPVGYLKADGASICFMDNEGVLLGNYQIVDNLVVWQA